METGKIINGNCIDEMSKMPESSIDFMVTSPPYNCNINYDTHKDNLIMDDYWDFTKQWLQEAFRVLKDDGRVAINIPYEVNVQDRGGRVLFLAEFWMIMKSVGFKFFGLVDLEEESPHRSKTTAWGSWMSPSCPYIYNPKECVVLAYKKNPKKEVKGEPQWIGIKDEETNKVKFTEEDKKEFMDLVFGQWNYFADTKQMTKATFSMDIPTKAIKILTFKNEIVLDPFAGSGTSLVAAEVLDRRWIGIELSPNYADVAKKRTEEFKQHRRQLKLDEIL